MRGRHTALTVTLTPDERETLTRWQRSPTIRAGEAKRGRLILLLAEGLPVVHVATMVGITRRFGYKWAQQFLQHGIEGRMDKPGRGHRPRLMTAKGQQASRRQEGADAQQTLLGGAGGLWNGQLGEQLTAMPALGIACWGRRSGGAGISCLPGTLVSGDTALLRVRPTRGRHIKERHMRRFAVVMVLLALVVGSGVTRVLAHSDGGDYSVWPRVVATVTTVTPRGMATIQTRDGTTYDVIQGTTWRVGDRVECEQHPRVRMPWQAFDCWKIS